MIRAGFVMCIVLAVLIMFVGYRALAGRQADPQAGIAAGENAGAAGAGAGAQPAAPKTQIIGSLLRLAQTIWTGDQQANDQVHNALSEADVKLQDLLGENSKRLIMEANRRPPTPVIDFYGPGHAVMGVQPPRIKAEPAGPVNPPSVVPEGSSGSR
ncbi:MAG: hypothetical protein ABR915_10185 [Thermoguttaceae bacterium]|jgi:hypothetical protein